MTFDMTQAIKLAARHSYSWKQRDALRDAFGPLTDAEIGQIRWEGLRRGALQMGNYDFWHEMAAAPHDLSDLGLMLENFSGRLVPGKPLWDQSEFINAFNNHRNILAVVEQAEVPALLARVEGLHIGARLLVSSRLLLDGKLAWADVAPEHQALLAHGYVTQAEGPGASWRSPLEDVAELAQGQGWERLIIDAACGLGKDQGVRNFGALVRWLDGCSDAEAVAATFRAVGQSEQVIAWLEARGPGLEPHLRAKLDELIDGHNWHLGSHRIALVPLMALWAARGEGLPERYEVSLNGAMEHRSQRLTELLEHLPTEQLYRVLKGENSGFCARLRCNYMKVRPGVELAQAVLQGLFKPGHHYTSYYFNEFRAALEAQGEHALEPLLALFKPGTHVYHAEPLAEVLAGLGAAESVDIWFPMLEKKGKLSQIALAGLARVAQVQGQALVLPGIEALLGSRGKKQRLLGAEALAALDKTPEVSRIATAALERERTADIQAILTPLAEAPAATGPLAQLEAELAAIDAATRQAFSERFDTFIEARRKTYLSKQALEERPFWRWLVDHREQAVVLCWGRLREFCQTGELDYMLRETWTDILKADFPHPRRAWMAAHLWASFSPVHKAQASDYVQHVFYFNGEAFENANEIDGLLELLRDSPPATLDDGMEHVLKSAWRWKDHDGYQALMAQGVALKRAAGRKVAVEMLQSYGRRPAVEALWGLLGVSAASVRQAVAEVLAALPEADSRPHLEAALEGEKAQKVVVALQEALKACGDTSLVIAVPESPDAASDARLDRAMSAYGVSEVPDGVLVGAAPALDWVTGAALSAAARGWLLSRLPAWGDEGTTEELVAVLGRLSPDSLEALADAALGTPEAMRLVEGWRLAFLRTHGRPAHIEAQALKIEAQLHSRGYNSAVKAARELMESDRPEVVRWMVRWRDFKDGPAVRRDSAAALERAAAAAGLSVDDLCEAHIDPMGFDECGLRPLDFGGRPLVLSLTTDGAVEIFEQSKRLKSLPSPRSGDDPDGVAAARETLKVLRRDLKALAREQAVRLEESMITGRAWPLARWRSIYVEQPVLQALGRGVVWRLEAGVVAFGRIDDFGALVGLDEAPLDIAEGATVQVAHPFELGDEATEAWLDVMTQAGLKAPFSQLTRTWPAFDHAQGEEAVRGALLDTEALPPVVMDRSLKKRGYERGPVGGAGLIRTADRALVGGWTLRVTHGGIFAGAVEVGDPVMLERIEALRGDEVVPWDAVSPGLVAAALVDLAGLG